MPLNLSTAAAAQLVGATAFATIFGAGNITVYGTVAQPANADLGVGAAVPLARISVDGAAFVPGSGVGLNFEQSGRYVAKSTVQTWVITGLTTGTALWWRLTGGAFDDGEPSLTRPRLDGACSTVAAPTVGLILPTLSITPALSREVQQFVFSL